MLSSNPNRCLSCVAHNGDIEEIKKFIDSNPRPSDLELWSLGHDLLLKAMAPEKQVVRKFLLKSVVTANSKSEHDSELPLYWNGAPLWRAVGTDNIEIMKSLLEKNCPVDESRTDPYLGPLRMAAQLNNSEIAKVLIDCRYQYRSQRQCPVVTDNLETVKLLLHASVDINERPNDESTALKIAIRLAKKEISKVLFNRRYFNKTLIQTAIETNNTDVIGRMDPHDIEAKSHNDFTPLHIAAQLRNTEVAKILLKHGADLNSVCISALGGLLSAAIEKGESALVELLLKKGCKIIGKTRNGRTLLHLVIWRKYRKVTLALNHDVDVGREWHEAYRSRARDKEHSSSSSISSDSEADEEWHEYLQSRAKHGRKYVYRLAQRNDGDIDVRDKHNKNILCFVVEGRRLSLIERIVAHSDMGGPVETQSMILDDVWRYGFMASSEDAKDCSFLLHHAAHRVDSHLKIFECLLNLGSTFKTESNTRNGATPLHNAAIYKHIAIAEIIIKRKAKDLNAKDGDGKTPLHCALENIDMDIIELTRSAMDSGTGIGTIFFISGVNVDKHPNDKKTALKDAADERCEKFVELLLEHKVDVNAVDGEMETPLHYSAIRGNEKIVKMLLDAGATINAKRYDGATALRVAVEWGHAKVVELLIDNGADIADRNNEGGTLLHIAAAGDSPEIVEILLHEFDDVNCRDGGGKTALRVASERGNVPNVRLLLDHDCDINLVCNHGETPFSSTVHRRSLCSSWNSHVVRKGINFDNYYEEIMRMFSHHMERIVALKRRISQKNRETTYLSFSCFSICAECQREIKSMMYRKIGTSDASYYDVLTKDINRLALYARNKVIVDALEKGYYKDTFPLYSGFIHNRLKNGQKRAGLLDSSSKSLRFLTGYALPDFPTIELLGYLSNGDLKNLIKAGPCRESDN